MIDDSHAVADPLDDIELVAREDDGLPSVGLRAQDVGHRIDGHGVEARKRLVQHEQFRREHQCRRQLDALLVAMAQALELALGTIGESSRSSNGAEASRAALRVSPCSRAKYSSCAITVIFG